MDWPRLGAVLHTTGLWGRSYLGVGRRCCPQNLTESSVKEKTWVYREGNLTVEEYTYGITRRGIRPYGHLAQYRGWPETRAYWAWRQTAPPSLTAGGAWRIPPGFTVWGTELGEKKGARIPGWGGMAQQAWHRPVLPAHYLPNTREETGSTRRL